MPPSLVVSAERLVVSAEVLVGHDEPVDKSLLRSS
jgi:hypothetical protein